MISKMIS